MKVKVIKAHAANKGHKIGSVYDTTQERAKLLVKSGFVSIVPPKAKKNESKSN
tara:strand:- start:9 stop:167 length:159 start_codon:yes stop_codon:yes gene_type:complete